MDKAILMAGFAILKFGLALSGIILALLLAIPGIAKKDDVKLKKAAITFFGMIALILGITALEFLIISL